MKSLNNPKKYSGYPELSCWINVYNWIHHEWDHKRVLGDTFQIVIKIYPTKRLIQYRKRKNISGNFSQSSFSKSSSSSFSIQPPPKPDERPNGNNKSGRFFLLPITTTERLKRMCNYFVKPCTKILNATTKNLYRDKKILKKDQICCHF